MLIDPVEQSLGVKLLLSFHLQFSWCCSKSQLSVMLDCLEFVCCVEMLLAHRGVAAVFTHLDSKAAAGG